MFARSFIHLSSKRPSGLSPTSFAPETWGSLVQATRTYILWWSCPLLPLFRAAWSNRLPLSGETAAGKQGSSTGNDRGVPRPKSRSRPHQPNTLDCFFCRESCGFVYWCRGCGGSYCGWRGHFLCRKKHEVLAHGLVPNYVQTEEEYSALVHRWREERSVFSQRVPASERVRFPPPPAP